MPLEQALERQIFAERHQMHLVVDAEDRAVVIDHIDRIIGARMTRRWPSSGARTAPVISTVLGWQQIGDLRQRVRLARQEKRKRRFRPDQMRDVAHAVRLRAGRAVGQRADSAAITSCLGGVVEFLVLLQIGLHDAQLDAVDESRRMRRSRAAP